MRGQPSDYSPLVLADQGLDTPSRMFSFPVFLPADPGVSMIDLPEARRTDGAVRAPRLLTLRHIRSCCDSLDEHDEHACLIWRNAKNDNGIPSAVHGGRTRNVRRVVWSLIHGEEPSPAMCVVPRCGYSACLHPAHLMLITRSAAQRRHSAKYSSPLANFKRAEGRRNCSISKLNHAKAQEIRDQRGVLTAAEVGALHGVSKSMVHGIWQGKFWAPVAIVSSVFALHQPKGN